MAVAVIITFTHYEINNTTRKVTPVGITSQQVHTATLDQAEDILDKCRTAYRSLYIDVCGVILEGVLI